MKIGFDTSDLCTGREDGTTRYTAELAKRLPELGEEKWEFFAPFDFAQGKPLPINVKKILSPWPRYWTQSRLPFDLYRYPVDVMFMPIQQLPFFRPGSMKTVAVVHDLAFHVYPEQFTYKDWMLQHIFTAYACREADAIIAVSQATAADIAKFYGRTEGVYVVHHGVDHLKFNGKKEVREKGERPYILYVGQIQPRKNIIRLVQAFVRLKERAEFSKMRLKIAGGHGWLNSPIYRYIDQTPTREAIDVLGAVSEDMLVELYQNAEVFVLPSLYEGFGMPIVEAMAAGCPVVTSNVSCMPEIAGGAAVLVDPKSVEDIANGILDALERREELTEAGLQRAAGFSWDRTARETIVIIENLEKAGSHDGRRQREDANAGQRD